MKQLITIMFLFLAGTIYAQVGVGTPLPNASAQLDVVSSNKGVLIPRVALRSSTDAITISSGNVTSLIVYNTATIADIKPGYHYWDGVKWQRVSNADETTAAISKMVKNNDGTITHTSGSGVATTFAVYTTGIGAPTIAGTPGDMYVNESNGNVFTWNPLTSSWFNQSNIATLVLNIDGTYTYTNEMGVPTVIDVNKPNITGPVNGVYTVTKADGTVSTIDTRSGTNPLSAPILIDGVIVNGSVHDALVALNALASKVGAMTQNNTTGVITYTNENGVTSTADVTSTDASNILTTGLDGGSLLTTAAIHAVTTNTLTSTGNTITSMVNGMAASALAVNSVANNSVDNTLTTTVNGVIGTGVNIVNSISNTSNDNTLLTTVNGVPGSTVPIINSNILTNPVNTITSTVNGVATTAPAVNTVANTSSANTMLTTVNGVAGATVPIINSNALTNPVNTITSTVNGVATTAPAVNTVANTSSANTLLTTVNGVAGATVPIINSNALTSAANSLTSTVNNVAANLTPTAATIADVIGFDATGVLVKQMAGTLPNIYTSNGTLIADRTVTQADKTLAFTTDDTKVNAFSIDGTTFSVDALNNRVGLGIIAPEAKLDVDGVGFFRPVPGGRLAPAAGLGLKVEFSSNIDSGVLEAYDYSTGATKNLVINTEGGDVGIGTLTPQAKLDVNGRGFFRPVPGGLLVPAAGLGLKVEFSSNIDSGVLEAYDYATLTPKNLVINTDGGNVGIGTSAPSAKLHVAGGDVQFEDYPNTRNNIVAVPATNVLYTDVAGNVLSADMAAAVAAVTTNTLTSNMNDNAITSTVNGVASTLAPLAGTIGASKTLGFNAAGDLVIGDTVISADNGLTATGTNIQLGGALTQATTVSALTDVNKMSFTGTGVDAFNVDGTTLSVDATNDRVGIGTTLPTNTLHVVNQANPARLEGLQIGASTDLVITTDATGVLRTSAVSIDALEPWRTTISTAALDSTGGPQQDINYINGNVGIGTVSPSEKLHVNGNALVSGNVGIGTTSPTSVLHVVGLPIYVNNLAATTAGLTVGAFYHAGDGIVRVVF